MTAPVIDVPTPRDDDDDELDFGRLTTHLRTLGAPALQPTVVSAAFTRLFGVLHDEREAVAYLEHMAKGNRSFHRWLAKRIDVDELRFTVREQIGRHFTVDYPPLRAPTEPVCTIQELLAGAVTAETRLELIRASNRALDSGAGQVAIYDALCDRVFTLHYLILNHLLRDNAPRRAVDGEPEQVAIHSVAHFTVADETQLADMGRRGLRVLSW